MAKTFDNISEASATNYLFLFAQRTLALQDAPPTPPPLNALGLPCQVICRCWARRYPEEAAANEYLSAYLKSIGVGGTVAVKKKLAGESEQAGEAQELVVPSSDNALESTVAKVTADKKRTWLGSVNSDEATQTKTAPVEGTVAIEAISGEEATAVKAVAVDGQDATAAEALPSSPPPSPSPEEVVTPGEKTPLVKEKTLAEKIALLAEKITEYILDHQDDAAQEDGWRTIMKRDMTKSFHKVEKEMQAQREEVQGQREEMQQQFDDVLSKLNQLVRWQTSSSSV